MYDIKNLSEFVSDEMKVDKDKALWAVILLMLFAGTLKDDKKERRSDL